MSNTVVISAGFVMFTLLPTIAQRFPAITAIRSSSELLFLQHDVAKVNGGLPAIKQFITGKWPILDKVPMRAVAAFPASR